ncbi:hypothetical protein DM02DRAFT_387373 [Periconia macrospinosa]|uniref:Secreted protein n=1 Tax=Periconia macrospinosa TaxID=97972 RepID=A0A2V1DTP9_9PLEO|nr:hypothetical protein DM02DRAFT_387373 [Periconia macrospinosa]
MLCRNVLTSQLLLTTAVNTTALSNNFFRAILKRRKTLLLQRCGVFVFKQSSGSDGVGHKDAGCFIGRVNCVARVWNQE